MTPRRYKIKSAQVSSGERIEPNSDGLQPTPKLSFGFKFFQEIEGFGLQPKGKKISNKWMLSFIDKLRSLGQFSKDDFDSNVALAQAHRHHKINWNAPNIPVSRESFSQLPQEYQSDEEFPFWQFQLSAGTGRFFGFYDENEVFQIVGVDPLHNLQPAGGRFKYRVDSCSPLRTELYSVLAFLGQIHSKCKVIGSCPHCSDIDRIFSGTEGLESPVLAFNLSGEKYDEFASFQEDCYSMGYPIELADVFFKGLEAYRGELLNE